MTQESSEAIMELYDAIFNPSTDLGRLATNLYELLEEVESELKIRGVILDLYM